MMHTPACLLVFLATAYLHPTHAAPHTSLPLNVKNTLGYRRTDNLTSHTKHTFAVSDAILGGCYNTDFTVSTTIGGQGPFDLVIDTGSTSLGVVDSRCPSEESNSQSTCDDASPTYSATSSTSSSGSASASYGIGSFRGTIYTDSVSVGGTTAVPVKFISITSNNGFFTPGTCTSNTGNPTYEGILGLASQSIAVEGTTGWLDQYVSATGAANVFSFDVPNNQLYIGGFNADPTQIRNVTLNSQTDAGFYSVSVASMSVGSSSVSISSAAASGGFIIDTGTNSISLANDLFVKVVNIIVASQAFQDLNFPSDYFTNANDACVPQGSLTASQLNTMPTLTVTFNTGVSQTVSVTINAYPGYIYSVDTQLSTGGGVQSALCAGISPGGAAGSNTVNIFGLPFIGQFENTYDRTESIVGFYPSMYPSIQTGSIPTITSNVAAQAKAKNGSANSLIVGTVVPLVTALLCAIFI